MDDDIVNQMPLLGSGLHSCGLVLVASLKSVLVMVRIFSAHTVIRSRPFLFIFPSPCAPNIPFQPLWPLPTLAFELLTTKISSLA